jgi:hypothetical protein
MTFRKKTIENRAPLIEDRVGQSILVLIEKFVEFSKLFDEIKDYGKALSTMQPKQFNKKKDIMYSYIITQSNQNFGTPREMHVFAIDYSPTPPN